MDFTNSKPHNYTLKSQASGPDHFEEEGLTLKDFLLVFDNQRFRLKHALKSRGDLTLRQATGTCGPT